MKLWIALGICLLLTLGIGSAVQAQTTNTPTPTATLSNTQRAGLETVAPPAACGDVFNPCSKLPWAVPVLPTVALPSPTLINMPMADIGSTTPTRTPTPTGTEQMIDIGPMTTLSSGISNAASTLVAIGAVTVEAMGTASVEDLGHEVAGGMPSVFSTVRGILDATDNRAMSVVRFLFMCVLFMIGVILLTTAFPIIVNVIRFILQIITAFKPF
jgi:hypothetical protein